MKISGFILCVLITIWTRSQGLNYNNISTVCDSLEENLVTSLATKLLSLHNHCTLVLATDQRTFPSSILQLARYRHHQYGLVVATRMTSFTFRYSDYSGLTKQSELFDFRTYPPELRSSLWTGSAYSFTVMYVSSPQSFSQLTAYTAAMVQVRNLYDRFLIHFRRGGHPVPLVMSHQPANGMRLKLISTFRERHLELSTVCFQCGNTVMELGTYNDSSQDVQSLYPDTSRSLAWRDLKATYYDDRDMPEIRARLEKQGASALNPEERMFTTAERMLQAKLDVYVPDSFGEGVEYQQKNGTWVGSTGEILKGVAGVSLISFLTQESIKYIEVVNPAMFFHVTFVTRKPVPLLAWEVILLPYTVVGWALLCLAVVVSATFIYLVMTVEVRMSNMSRFSCWNGLTYLLRELTEQPISLPKSDTIRFFYSFFMFFTTVVICGYKTKLFSFLMTPPVEHIPDSFDDLINSDFKLVMPFIDSMYIRRLVEMAENPVYHRMMVKTEVMGKTHDCLARTLTGRYACISFDYFAWRDANGFMDVKGNSLLQFSGAEAFNSYSSPTTGRGDVYADVYKKMARNAIELNLVISSLKQEQFKRFLTRLFEIRKRDKLGADDEVLTKDKVKGMFVLWVLGSAFSILIYIAEYAFNKLECKRCRRRQRNAIIW